LLDHTYTDHVGDESRIDLRNDLQLQKVMIYFRGWLGTPRFRYTLYVWTANTSQGLGAQVVSAGNLTYHASDLFEIAVGIAGLPTTRSVRGQWPGWLKVDNRTIADEYFRGSYTTGVWASGTLVQGPVHGLHYKTMLGNNLSQLGIDAAQLNGGFDTSATALWWTFRDFGVYGAFGDFEGHQRAALSLGSEFTRSNETRQNQPGQNAPENTQVRVSDGGGIFDEGSLAEGVTVQRALYRMWAVDGALKYRGFGVDAEYFMRWVTDLHANGPLPRDRLFDHGGQLQLSAMLVKQTLQAYGFGSLILGQYGKPFDAGGGLNYFPFHTRILRFNAELLYAYHSPVGYLAYPIPVGATGPTFMANVEMMF